MRSEIGRLAETVAEMKAQRGSRPSCAAIVPINLHGQTLPSLETEIVQVLARGSKASVDERRVAHLLGVDAAERAVTDWANRLAARYQVTWSRRQRFGGLLFELVKVGIGKCE